MIEKLLLIIYNKIEILIIMQIFKEILMINLIKSMYKGMSINNCWDRLIDKKEVTMTIEEVKIKAKVKIKVKVRIFEYKIYLL